MLDRVSLLQVFELFHGVFLAFKLGLADLIQTETTSVAIHHMVNYIDLVFESMPYFVRIEFGDVEKTLKGFAELLVRSELAKEVAVEKTEKGFIFKVKECRFARRSHHLLEPKDVTCLYGILIFYLAEKSSGKKVAKALSEFTSTDAYTLVEFLEEP